MAVRNEGVGVATHGAVEETSRVYDDVEGTWCVCSRVYVECRDRIDSSSAGRPDASSSARC